MREDPRKTFVRDPAIQLSKIELCPDENSRRATALYNPPDGTVSSARSHGSSQGGGHYSRRRGVSSFFGKLFFRAGGAESGIRKHHVILVSYIWRTRRRLEPRNAQSTGRGATRTPAATSLHASRGSCGFPSARPRTSKRAPCALRTSSARTRCRKASGLMRSSSTSDGPTRCGIDGSEGRSPHPRRRSSRSTRRCGERAGRH